MGLVEKDFGPDHPTIWMASFLAKSMGGVSDSAQGCDWSRALLPVSMQPHLPDCVQIRCMPGRKIIRPNPLHFPTLWRK